MWQAPNPRARAQAAIKKRERDRSRKPLHYRRVTATIKVSAANGSEVKSAEARIVLNDLSAKGMGIFTNTALEPGYDVIISMQEPTAIDLKGRVVYCQRHSLNSHVISNQPHDFRAGIEFIFDSPDEEKTVMKFCDEFVKEYLRKSA